MIILAGSSRWSRFRCWFLGHDVWGTRAFPSLPDLRGWYRRCHRCRRVVVGFHNAKVVPESECLRRGERLVEEVWALDMSSQWDASEDGLTVSTRWEVDGVEYLARARFGPYLCGEEWVPWVMGARGRWLPVQSSRSLEFAAKTCRERVRSMVLEARIEAVHRKWSNGLARADARRLSGADSSGLQVPESFLRAFEEP